MKLQPYDQYIFPSRAAFAEICHGILSIIEQPEQAPFPVRVNHLSTFLCLLADEKNLRIDGDAVTSTFPALMPGYDGPPCHLPICTIQRVFLSVGRAGKEKGQL